MSIGRDEMMSKWDEEKRMKDIENVSAELADTLYEEYIHGYK